MSERLSLYELAATVRKALADANNECHLDVVAELGPLAALLDAEVASGDDFYVVGGRVGSEDREQAIGRMLEADLDDYGDALFEMTAGEEDAFVGRRREKMARLLAAAEGRE